MQSTSIGPLESDLEPTPKGTRTHGVAAALIALVALRLVTLGLYPLSDNTESRYAEIARRMAASGDWITPRIAENTVFWGKPPLSSWLSAASLQTLGLSEWAARLPSTLLALVVTLFVWRWSSARNTRWAGFSMAVLWGSGAFFLAAGAVMTDMALVTAVTMSMFGFWHLQTGASARSRRLHGYLLFAGLGLGMLAKGPVAVVLIGLPITMWAVLTRNLFRVIRTTPWIVGSMIAITIFLPWYALAELKTPGFLEYFLIGEHWLRFTQPGWSGDLYGTAHIQPRGMIWVYLIAGMLPCTVLVGALVFFRRNRTQLVGQKSSWLLRNERLYLLLWALAPALFFMLARNVLWTYVLPGIPALAVLAGQVLAADRRSRTVDALTCLGLALTGVLFASALIAQASYGGINSTKGVIEAYARSHQGRDDLLFLGPLTYSSSYYTRGQARNFKDYESLAGFVSKRAEKAETCQLQVHLAVSQKNWSRLSEEQRQDMHIEGQFGDYLLVTSDWHIKHERSASPIDKPIVAGPLGRQEV